MKGEFNMRYYVHRVEYNKEAQAENLVIRGYNDYDSALAAFHEYMRDDINNSNISRGNVMITNQNGAILKNEYWEEVQTPSV